MCFVLLLGTVGGCEKKKGPQLSAAEIHSITQELAASASRHVPAGTVIKLRQSASDKQAGSTDGIYIGLKNTPSGEAQGVALTKLIQALDGVATRHQLTQDAPITNANSVRITLRASGAATHEIQIVERASVGADREQKESPAISKSARLAIILDDLGSDRGAADAIFALPFPLTISVLPNHVHSVDIAEEAHKRGYEVMLHLPMQSVGKEQPEKEELRPGMPASEVTTIVDQFLQSVPNVVGVNNHQGSQATSDGALMSELMPVLRDRNLFYVDSRTTAATVAYDTAQKSDVRSGFRNVPFLDDVAEVGAVRKQLELALRGAREKGGAIAIGHPHPATLQALREVLPNAGSQGVQLVFASDLVH